MLGNHFHLRIKKIFYEDAIVGHVGVENLRNLQRHSREYEKSTGKYPKAPDLFIVDHKKNFIFMEVKLPGDRFKKQQDDGLKLLKMHLKAEGADSIIVKKIKLMPT